MAFLTSHLLTWILFLPIAVAVVLLFIPREQKNALRWVALLGSLLPLALSIYLWFQFDPGQTGFQFQESFLWFPPSKVHYFVGVDGLSLTLVLLSTLLTSASILASWNIKDELKAYLVLFMLQETGMLGVFLSLDLVLFFVFWEIGVIPMFFLIHRWGSPKGERKIWGGIVMKARTYAAFKFLVYSIVGSVGLLFAAVALTRMTGTSELPTILREWPNASGSFFGLSVDVVKALAFWGLALAFAIKVPLWPFHTWLPDAHTEAPTAGSMILAGVLLKLGGYGFLRLVLPLFPEMSKHYAGLFALLAMLSIVLGAFAAYGQTDFKRLVAYSSVNHMGFMVLGMAVAAAAIGTKDAIIAYNGAVLQMFNHGLSAAGMFFLVGVLYDRAHTRDLEQFGGLFPLVPVYGGILLFTSMASLGLPGLNGFVSEFLVVRGAWPVFTLFTALSMLGLLFTGAYILKAIKMVLHGPLNEHWVGHLTDISPREVVVIAPLMVLMLWIGVWPMWILDIINKAAMYWLG